MAYSKVPAQKTPAYNKAPAQKPSTTSHPNPAPEQGRNTGSDASDYQKYLNDGINQNDWRDPITDSAALDKAAQAMFEKQLKQVSEMNRQGATKKGQEERQTAMMQQASNERIAAMQNQQPYQRKNEIPQSSTTLQYNANAAEKISTFASNAEKSAARAWDQKTIFNQQKHDQRMAMHARGHEARMAQKNNMGQQTLARIQGQQAGLDRQNQLKIEGMQGENELKRIAAESASRFKESQMQLAGQKEIVGMQTQADIQKNILSASMNSGRGGGYSGYW